MRDTLRSNRPVVVIVGGVLGLLVVLTVLNRESAYPTTPLHPSNPDPVGARAVARTLDAHGVPVRLALDSQALTSARVDRDTTLAVSAMEGLGQTTAQQLVELAADAGAVVLIEPPRGLLPFLGIDVDAGDPVAGRLGAGCPDPLVQGLEVEVRPSSGLAAPDDAVSCFGDDGAALLVRLDGPAPTYVVGGDLFTNRGVRKADNAAAALRLLGQGDRLVWYVPDPHDVAAGDGVSVSSLLPRWLGPSVILLVAAFVALALWRGRRLGPVVVEPLPVVVRNSEAVEARGRLYRKARDVGHAAEALRAATRTRLARRLVVDEHRLPGAVASVTGRPEHEVAGLLGASPITDERALVALANDLTDLEDQVAGGES